MKHLQRNIKWILDICFALSVTLLSFRFVGLFCYLFAYYISLVWDLCSAGLLVMLDCDYYLALT